MTEVAGVYNWSHPGGNFIVNLRPNGIFYCKQYSAAATWSIADGTISINWKNYGNYELVQSAPGAFDGSVVGNPTKWRKLEFVRPFSEAEQLLMGEGGGSVWSFEYEKGAFEVEFRVDGLNHFVCNSYPAHSHWNVDESGKVLVDWSKYGSYELVLDAGARLMEGFKVGQPANWRRARWLRPLGLDTLSSVPAHDHSHQHGEGCSHGHAEGEECGHHH